MSTNAIVRVKSTVRGAAAGATGAVAVSAVAGTNIAHLVGKLGWDNDAALALVALLASSGMAAIAVVYPVLAPFLGTIRALMWMGGTGAVVGF